MIPLPCFFLILLQSNAASEFVIFSFARDLLHRGEMLLRSASDQNIIFVSCELLEDASNLRRCLPRSQNHLGHAGADGAVMVNLGEAEVLEGHVTQTFERLVGRHFSLLDVG